jgi:hypothetical protein
MMVLILIYNIIILLVYYVTIIFIIIIDYRIVININTLTRLFELPGIMKVYRKHRKILI